MSLATKLKKEIRNHKNAEQAKNLEWFFKTGKGEYGEGDKFLGIKNPVIRKTIKNYFAIDLPDLDSIIQSKFHEERLAALLILVRKYQKAKIAQEQIAIHRYYRNNMQYVNNWDLVDQSAPTIIGQHLFERDRKVLYQWAKSKNLWHKRIAMLATFYFIRNNDFADAFKISEILLQDKHDLIHKAVGWMLREVGKRDLPAEEKFLQKHYKIMPRTMLRYAIEKFPERERQAYLYRGK
ncbi:MAG: DNA alkylation repair protein [Gammaproteobacteria bacterium]|jgi:3-methyladenine DNA glycosylase AlkD